MINTEEKIQQSALKHFLSAGFKKTSIDEIAEDAGVAKGTVYNYFTNKQDLFIKTAICWRKKQDNEIASQISRIDRADDKILAHLRLEFSLLRQMFKDYGMNSKVLRELIEVKKSIAKLHQRDVDMLESYLLTGLEQGIFHPQPTTYYAELLKTVFYQFAERWISIEDESVAIKELNTLFTLLLKGMKK